MPSGKKERCLKKKYSLFFSNSKGFTKAETRAGEQRARDIPITERVKNNPEETDPVLRNIDANVL